MTATSIPEIRDFHDVVKLLETHPEWRTDLRRLILTDELLSLPQEMAQLVVQVSRFTDQMTTLTEVIQRVSVDVGRLKGDGLEVRYTLRGVPLVTRIVRHPHPLSLEELDTLLADAETQGLLSAQESEEITLTDLVISGKQRSTGTPIYLVTEISWGVGIDDVQRAATRASLFAKTGKHVIPAVAGEWVTPDAQQLAPGLGVWQFTPSRVVAPSP
jgi:hypothetical protein